MPDNVVQLGVSHAHVHARAYGDLDPAARVRTRHHAGREKQPQRERGDEQGQ